MIDPERRCDGIRRRDVLRVGALTALGLGLTDWIRLRAEVPAGRRGARGCILVWLDGGPSHLETFDPKPDAPREVRGPFGAIPTRADGLQLCEHLERTARVADRIAVVRSVTSPLGEHNLGSHYMLTGYRPSPALVYPSLGSVIAHTRPPTSVLPPLVNVGNAPNGMLGAGYLPASAAPFVPGGDPARPDFAVRDLDLYPAVTEERLGRRREFVAQLDRFARAVEGSGPPARPADPVFEQAFRMVTSPRAKEAFDLADETDVTRRRYGTRTLGQSCLLARRLIERGVPFVTVTDRGWDTHTELYTRLREGYTGGTVGKVPVLDAALSALVEDLQQRGLLEETLVIVMGEFGRTPKINTRGGRDHWPRVFSVALAGAGVPGGLVLGRSDPVGESPADRPVTPADLARTIYLLLGVDPEHEFVTSDGRPVMVNRDGRAIAELLA